MAFLLGYLTRGFLSAGGTSSTVICKPEREDVLIRYSINKSGFNIKTTPLFEKMKEKLKRLKNN